jgi:hypothetical protein
MFVVIVRAEPDSPDAFSNARPTPRRLAMLAAMRTRSAAGRESSSRVAIRWVVAASAPRTTTQIHAHKIAAAVSQARRLDICQGATVPAAPATMTPTEPDRITRTNAVTRRLSCSPSPRSWVTAPDHNLPGSGDLTA